jgi:2-keto-3-deoxy-6-phosphogluconate aldolase
MSTYLKAGVCGFGIGSNIVKKDLIEKGDFDAITKLAKKYVSIVENS